MRYDADRESACATNELLLACGELRSGNDGNFMDLVRLFLSGFSVPQAVLEILEPLKVKAGISHEAWEWVANLSTSAQLKDFEWSKGPVGAHPKTILAVRERDAVLDLLSIPLQGLMDLVSHFSYQWRPAAVGFGNQAPSIYYESKMPSEFLAYVEHKVASYYVPLITQMDLNRQNGIRARYRAVTVYGRASAEDPDWEAARVSAIAMAKSTFTPI